MDQLNEKMSLAIWIAGQLFARRMGPGTTGNLSFLHDDVLYITASGTCFGNLKPEDFTAYHIKEKTYTGKKPSKELQLHLSVYQNRQQTQAVIHVHSTYAVLYSCIAEDTDEADVPEYTPYLKMKVGKVGMIPYAKPGSTELFEQFEANMRRGDAWLLKNHGPVVGGKDLMDAFACLEELEEACRIAWELKDMGVPQIGKR